MSGPSGIGPELGKVLRDLEEIANGARESVEGAFARMANLESRHEKLEERVDDLESKLQQCEQRLDQLGDIGSHKTDKEQKVAAIVTYASNSRKDRPARTVLPKEIQGVADVGERYAYKLCDQMINGDGENGTIGPDGYAWAHDPQEISRHLEKDKPQRGVLIDFDGVQGDPVPLNKFNNANAGEGVAD